MCCAQMTQEQLEQAMQNSQPNAQGAGAEVQMGMHASEAEGRPEWVPMARRRHAVLIRCAVLMRPAVLVRPAVLIRTQALPRSCWPAATRRPWAVSGTAQGQQAAHHAAPGAGQCCSSLQCSLSSPGVCRGQPDPDFSEKLRQAMAQKSEELVKQFQEDWSEVMENMAEAEDALDDLSGADLATRQRLPSCCPPILGPSASAWRGRAHKPLHCPAVCERIRLAARRLVRMPPAGPLCAAMAQAVTRPPTACRGADLVDAGSKGFDQQFQGFWRNSGWRAVAQLRRKLEHLRELRDLVRSLGRSSGKGPKRRAPQRVRARLLDSRACSPAAQAHPHCRCLGAAVRGIQAPLQGWQPLRDHRCGLPVPAHVRGQPHQCAAVSSAWHVQVLVTSGPEGVVRSELQPEETSGLARSSDISRMLPMEAHLLAHGWAARTALTKAGTPPAVLRPATCEQPRLLQWHQAHYAARTSRQASSARALAQ